MTDRNFKTFKIEFNTPEEAEKFFNDPKVIRKLVQIENSTLKTIKKEKRDGYCVLSQYNLARILRISYANQKTLKIEDDICTPDEITQFLAKIYSNNFYKSIKSFEIILDFDSKICDNGLEVLIPLKSQKWFDSEKDETLYNIKMNAIYSVESAVVDLKDWNRD